MFVTPWHRRFTDVVALAVVVVVTTSACASGSDPATVAGDGPTTSGPASATASASASAPGGTGAVEAFRAWLEASRQPDAATACAGLAPALQKRMIAELNGGGPVRVDGCEQMITATAQLYKATGDRGDVDISVQDETATAATLFVTYRTSGDCGTVVMARTRGDWIITEQSQECGAGKG